MYAAFFLAGCATISGALDPQTKVNQIADQACFSKESIPTHVFKLAAYTRLENQGKPLTVYIEGDGRAWLSKTRLANDPTPFHPLVLTLAALDRSPNVVYLARPCQYDSTAYEKPCESSYWSDKRFSEEVIASTDEAIDVLSKRVGASQINLIGYSGGGAVAVLVAARRHDILSLRTIAGNLDHEAVNRRQGVSPLNGSLNAIDTAVQVSTIPQEHLVGAKDKIVPGSVAQDFARRANNPSCIKIIEIPEASHSSGWVEAWPEILRRTPACKDGPNHSIPNLKSR